ncbi:MAG: chemotaxis protein CheW [Deltaproteobacteria bacterium]|nr:chemotaxis protein CheW [Deltaproteobacteria bacterium]
MQTYDALYNDKLVFSLAGEYIGIDVPSIKGIVDVDEFFPVPMSLPVIKGVINQQGEIIPVIEPALLLGLEVKSGAPFRIVIIKHDDVMLGLSIDVSGMYFLWKEETADENLKPINNGGYFKAIIETGDRRIKLLDLKAVAEGVENIIKAQNKNFPSSTLHS